MRDEGGEGLPGVEITAKSPSLQGLRTILSSKNGNFRFPLLPVGIYILTFKLEGFAPLVQENVIVRLGKVTDLNVAMKLSEIREEIVVVAEAPLIDKTSTDTSFHLTSEDLEKIPAQNRTVIDAVKITPGVTGVRFNTRRGNATQGQPSFRGEGEEGNNWIVDGLSISGVRLRNSGMHLNFDSIDEIQAISDSFIQPTDKDLGPAQYYVEDLARNINNSYGDVTDDQKRLDFNIKLTKYLETETFGRHELILGFEYYSFSSEFGVEFTGRDEDLFPDNGFDTGTKYYFSSYRTGSVTPSSFYEYGEFDFRNSSRGMGLYFKDKVTWGRFTFMAGFRSQTQAFLDHRKEELWSWNLRDFLSPRFSLAVDLTGDGMNILSSTEK